MKKLLVLLGAILLASPVFAQSFPETSIDRGQRDNPSSFRVNRVFGHFFGLDSAADATRRAVDFGFEADYVEVCLQHDASRTYLRFGTALPANATSSANFIAGVTGSLSGRAMPIFPGGQNTVGGSATSTPYCVSGPWATNGIIVHSAGTATMDVRAYAE